jgi:hypothetical protein
LQLIQFCILRLYNIYGLPTCHVMSFPIYVCLCLCLCVCVFFRIYIYLCLCALNLQTHMWQTYLSTMAARVDLIVFFLCFLHLSNNLVEADWGLSLKEELKFQKRLINLKKSALKSIQVRFLEVILLILLF